LSSRQVSGDASATRLHLGISNGHVRGLIRCALPWKLQVDDDLLMELEHMLGSDAVSVDY
jgi:hypothetical protein